MTYRRDRKRGKRSLGSGLLVGALLTVALALPATSSAVVPGAAPNCTQTVSPLFTTSTPVAIEDLTTSTSMLEVSGAGPYLADVDVLTKVLHTFASDIEMTLESPSGTIVTLSTDNGGGNDDVFANTVWDDDANPGGQVPYENNNGLVTDHAYENLVAATPLVPEEALAAFIGENPNGTWTLTIYDDAGGDSGTLEGWSLQLATLPGAPETENKVTNALTVPVAIEDNTTSTSTLEVSGAAPYLAGVDVLTELFHTFSADIEMTLESPGGTIVTLSTDNGGGNDDVFSNTIWDDDADPEGQVPYAGSVNLATDHTYENLSRPPRSCPRRPLRLSSARTPTAPGR